MFVLKFVSIFWKNLLVLILRMMGVELCVYIAENGKGKESLNDRKGGCPKSSAARSFTFRELATATRGFKEVNLIGEGGFGRVYKGKLESNQVSSHTFLQHCRYLLDDLKICIACIGI